MMRRSVFFGNGLNHYSDNNVTWGELLTLINKASEPLGENVPYPLKFEQIILSHSFGDKKIDEIELTIKNEISSLLNDIHTNQFYEELIELNFTNYISTNYDYALINAYQKLYPEQGISFKSTEKIYSIRRHYNLNIPDELNSKFWQIHGEVKVPKSIMLGLDQYCGSIGKIDRYLKGQGLINKIKVSSIAEKLKSNEFDGNSWIEAFFNTDVHMIGFGLDYSETDIWWMLNRRARELKRTPPQEHNRIIFYDIEKNEERDTLLKSLNVDVVITEVGNGDFKKHYETVIKLIKGESSLVNPTYIPF